MRIMRFNSIWFFGSAYELPRCRVESELTWLDLTLISITTSRSDVWGFAGPLAYMLRRSSVYSFWLHSLDSSVHLPVAAALPASAWVWFSPAGFLVFLIGGLGTGPVRVQFYNLQVNIGGRWTVNMTVNQWTCTISIRRFKEVKMNRVTGGRVLESESPRE